MIICTITFTKICARRKFRRCTAVVPEPQHGPPAPAAPGEATEDPIAEQRCGKLPLL